MTIIGPRSAVLIAGGTHTVFTLITPERYEECRAPRIRRFISTRSTARPGCAGAISGFRLSPRPISLAFTGSLAKRASSSLMNLSTCLFLITTSSWSCAPGEACIACSTASPIAASAPKRAGETATDDALW